MSTVDHEDLDWLRRVQDLANRRGDYCPPAFAAELACAIPGEPKPAARARSKAGQRPYTPQGTRAAERSLIVELRQLIARRRWDPSGNWQLAVIFYRSTLRSVDGDNLAKLLKDAITRARIWDDDRQCTHESVTVDVDRKRPRTVLLISRHTATRMDR